MKQLFCDCKADEEKANFFLSGRAVETGIIASAISNDVAMAYHRCAEFQKEIDALRAKIAEMERQEPVATVIKEGDSRYWMSERLWTFPDGKYPLYALPGAQPAANFADAYQGAMEEVAIWKKRALEAENLNRKFVAEINGPTYMGEPAQPAPSVPDGWQLVPTAESRHPGIYKMLGALHAADNTPGMSEWESYRDMLAAAPEAKP